jgi:deoxyribodipyrimidine photo-lyase
VGNDPRENRHLNVLKQAQEYDPKGEYVKTWLPELALIPAKMVHTPFNLNLAEKVLYHIDAATYPDFIAESPVKIISEKDVTLSH